MVRLCRRAPHPGARQRYVAREEQTMSAADEHPGLGPGRERLRGKVAVVTGANSGIGRATARLFAREGARVVGADLRESDAVRVDRLIASDGGEAVFVQADVRQRSDCDRMIAAAVEAF